MAFMGTGIGHVIAVDTLLGWGSYGFGCFSSQDFANCLASYFYSLSLVSPADLLVELCILGYLVIHAQGHLG